MRNLISSYLENRRILLEKEEEMEVTVGVAQGSILEPTLWNILYDGVLRIELTQMATSIGFADDLALVVSADDEVDLMRHTNECLRRTKME